MVKYQTSFSSFSYLPSKALTAPNCRWTDGHVALLGDSAHAMQPNLGQGGCMAIEDGYQLAADLSEAVAKADGYPNLEAVLKVSSACEENHCRCLIAESVGNKVCRKCK